MLPSYTVASYSLAVIQLKKGLVLMLRYNDVSMWLPLQTQRVSSFFLKDHVFRKYGEVKWTITTNSATILMRGMVLVAAPSSGVGTSQT